jgi:hypothetical protein
VAVRQKVSTLLTVYHVLEAPSPFFGRAPPATRSGPRHEAVACLAAAAPWRPDLFVITRFLMKRQTVLSRKRGPPATGKGLLIGVRLQPDNLSALDGWITGQPDPKPTRPEAIRRLFELGLKHAPSQPERSPEPVVTAAPAEPASLWPMPTEVEQAISTAQEPITQRNPKAASKASDMAGKQIDKLGDASATVEERQSRKRRLLKGPKEFRDIRTFAEQPKRKK